MTQNTSKSYIRVSEFCLNVVPELVTPYMLLLDGLIKNVHPYDSLQQGVKYM